MHSFEAALTSKDPVNKVPVQKLNKRDREPVPDPIRYKPVKCTLKSWLWPVDTLIKL